MNTDTPGRLGIFGGSFDPVHYAHLLLAESCREQCHLDQVWLLPAASAPHKLQRQTNQLHDIASRCCGWRLVVTGRCVSVPWKSIAEVSATPSKRSTTIHQQLPHCELFFLMGADSLEDLPHWRSRDAFASLAVPVVVRRAGSPEPSWTSLSHLVDAERLALLKACQVTMPIIELGQYRPAATSGSRSEHSLSHAARRRKVYRNKRPLSPVSVRAHSTLYCITAA